MMTCVPDHKWVFECGCDPMVEHCEQCDARFKVRDFGMELQKLRDAEANVKALRCKLGLQSETRST